MGEQRQLHPRETMDDITEVSSTASIERKNTFMITKSTEARSKTVFSTIIGGVIGLLICLMLAPIIGITFGVVFILIGIAYYLVLTHHSSWSAKSKTGPSRSDGKDSSGDCRAGTSPERFSTPIRISQSI